MQKITAQCTFNGYCARCQKKIEKGQEFFFDKSNQKKYHVEHTPQTIPAPQIVLPIVPEKTYRENVETKTIKTLNVQSHLVPKVAELFDGKFSIPCTLNGSASHVTVWLKTAKKNHSFPGSRIIKIAFGRNLEGKEFLKCGFINLKGEFHYYREWHTNSFSPEKKKIVIAALKLVFSGEENAAFGVQYAKICRHCWRCGRHLYDPYTLEHLEERHGLGPECFRIIGDDAQLLSKIEQQVQKKVTIISL